MAEIEQTIAEKIADELDAGEAPAAQPGMATLHGGPGTAQGLNYAPGVAPSGDNIGPNEGAGTRPLGGDYVSPEVTTTADAAQERAEAFAATVAQVKIDRAIADASLRRVPPRSRFFEWVRRRIRTSRRKDQIMSTDDNPFPGPAEDVTTAEGMSVDDAVASAYDDHDRARNGIAEGERENVGQYLKYHADAAGTTVINGLDALIAPAITLRHGSQHDKRTLLGDLVDNYNIRDIPTVQSQAPEYGPPAAGADGQAPSTEAEADAVVQDFIAANPIAQDHEIQDFMIHVVGDMRAKGFQPDLGQAFEIAVANHPRYSGQAQGDEVARARAAGGQVSGSGSSSPNQTSDDVADIINELTPSW